VVDDTTAGADDDGTSELGSAESPAQGSNDVRMPHAVLANLPEPLRAALSQPGVPPQVLSMTLAAFSASYSGPLPPAEQIRQYEEVLPGSADRILSMAERQEAHRHELEKLTVKEATNRSWWGLRLGFVLAVIIVLVGAGAIFTGHTPAGLAAILTPTAILAGVFVYGRREQTKERIAKDQQTTRLPFPPTGPPTES
jgi:uncharacterized membrane protein